MITDRFRTVFTTFTLVALVIVFASPLPAGAERRRGARVPDRPSLPLDCNASELPDPLAEQCREVRLAEGRRLFDSETFGGNGRTCATCHSAETGTFSIEDVRRRLAANPNDPLFLHDALDGGLAGTSRIETDATIRVTLSLPRHLTLVGQPGVRQVTVNRATPTTMNTPALDGHLMSDLRDGTLTAQALGAIRGHAQNGIEPTPLQLELIAEFQQNDRRFFSSEALWRFARTGVAPQLPEGTTEAEKRGRRFFEDVAFNPARPHGVCALCHSGPMLNEANRFSTAVFGNPPGARIFSVGVSERNLRGNPTFVFQIDSGQGVPQRVTTPDIGVLFTDPASTPLIAQEIPPPGFGPPLSFFANMFKTPTLWGVKQTAPYFHDNSARDLDEMLEHYNWFFRNGPFREPFQLTPQEIEDIKAFMNLL